MVANNSPGCTGSPSGADALAVDAQADNACPFRSFSLLERGNRLASRSGALFPMTLADTTGELYSTRAAASPVQEAWLRGHIQGITRPMTAQTISTGVMPKRT